jgi:hemoglobin
MPFEIDEQARQVWLWCFEKTLEGADQKYQFPLQHMAGFKEFLRGFSAWMVNKKS